MKYLLCLQMKKFEMGSVFSIIKKNQNTIIIQGFQGFFIRHILKYTEYNQ